MNDKPPSERTRVRRLHERGRYDAATIHALLDAAPWCHVGYVIDGAPFVTPTLHWRDGDWVYWHGSAASRMLRQAEGAPVCLTVSLLDGYVLARSAFNHSVNYRSAMLFGTAAKVAERAEKEAQLRLFLEGLFPGRWDELRPMTEQELKATTVLKMRIDEASAKVRTGPPGDADEAAVPVWAGVLPVETRFAAPIRAEGTPPDIALPDYLKAMLAEKI
jgi:nitroimidazol reductase NimA-like FMN-containing flavoprotein (pyridoxamine 5'-phosphate oxidase superfamily)